MAFGIKSLLIFGAIMILSATTGRIFFKKMTDQMPRYPYFLTLFITLVAVPFYFLTLAIKTYQYKRKGAFLYAALAEDMSIQADAENGAHPSVLMSVKRYTHAHTFPKYKLALMGGLDSMASVLMVFGGNGTSGPLQALLTQGVIPIVLVLSFIFLKTRYTWNQYLGAFLVLAGVFVVFAPNIFTPEGAIYWPLMTFSANLPTAISSVLKELSFKNALINVYYMQAWVALFQFCAAILLFPLNLIPHFGHLTITEIPENMLDAMRCFVGLSTAFPDDNCSFAWYPVVGYAVCNFIFNITSLYVIKEVSSAVVYIQNAVRLPLITVAFHMAFIMGNAALPWDYTSYYLFGGLAVILAGLGLYMFTAVRDLQAKLRAQNSEKSPLLGDQETERPNPETPAQKAAFVTEAEASYLSLPIDLRPVVYEAVPDAGEDVDPVLLSKSV